MGPWSSTRVHLRHAYLGRCRHHTASLGPWCGSRIHLSRPNLPWCGRHRSTPLRPRRPRSTHLWRNRPCGYLGSWNSSSGGTIQRRLNYVGRELTPALRHGDQAQRVEEFRAAEEASLVPIGVHPYLGEDLLRQVGALEESNGLLAADAAVLVQIRAAEVGLEGLRPRHLRDLRGRSRRR